MSSLSPRLQLRVAQKQILTPGLVQMVTVLQLNRLELKDMITRRSLRTRSSKSPPKRRGGDDARKKCSRCSKPSRADPADNRSWKPAVLSDANSL